MFVDFKKCNAIPLAKIFERFSIHLKENGKGELRGDCPLPNHGGNPKNSFVLNPEKNTWKCYGSKCKTSRADTDQFPLRVVDFVAAQEGVSAKEAANHIADWFGIPKGKGESPKEAPAVKVVEAPTPVATVEQKAERYMETLDKWLREVLTCPEGMLYPIWKEQAIKKLKAKVLESYREGKKAGLAA